MFARNEALQVTDQARAEFVLASIPGDVHTVLEVGAGSGIVSRVIAKKYKLTCVELSTSGVKILTELGLTCHQANIADLPFLDNSFDLVVASEVLEHLDDELFSKGLGEIARVASRYILTTFPNKEWFPSLRQECPKCRTVSVPWTHIRRFDVKMARKLFDPFNFACKQMQRFGPLVPDTSSLMGRILMWHAGFYNRLRPGTMCPICKYEQPGSPPKRPLFSSFATRPLPTARYVLDRVSSKLCPKCPRWILALYESPDLKQTKEGNV